MLNGLCRYFKLSVALEIVVNVVTEFVHKTSTRRKEIFARGQWVNFEN